MKVMYRCKAQEHLAWGINYEYAGLRLGALSSRAWSFYVIFLFHSVLVYQHARVLSARNSPIVRVVESGSSCRRNLWPVDSEYQSIPVGAHDRGSSEVHY